MDRGFSHYTFDTVPLSPLQEMSEMELSEAREPLGSVFDPPEENEVAYSGQHENPQGDEQHLSPDPTPQSSQHTNVESEGILTRSKTGTTSKNLSLAPENGNGSIAVRSKRKPTKKSTKKVSKETQVMPRMLPPVKKRASKKASEDPGMKENMPPKDLNKEKLSLVRMQASKTKEHEDHGPPDAPRKHQSSREVQVNSELFNTWSSMYTGVGRRLPTSSPVNTSTDADNVVASSESTIQEPYEHLSSSQFHDEYSSIHGISSLAADEDLREEINERENDLGPHSNSGEYCSTPLSAITIKIPHSDHNEQPMALSLHPGIFKHGNVVAIKMSHGKVQVSTEETFQKNEKKKSSDGRKSRGSRRTRKESWTSSDTDSGDSSESDDSTDSSCSCTSTDSYESCCDSSTSSCDSDHHRHHHRRRH